MLATDELAGRIRARIEEYLSSRAQRFAWSFEAVRRFEFLPLYFGWTALLGMCPDASLILWEHEDEAARAWIRELNDPFLRRLALAQGAKRYPELESLVPVRPANGEECESCGGTGRILGLPEDSNVICYCGGLGWVIPGERREVGIR